MTNRFLIIPLLIFSFLIFNFKFSHALPLQGFYEGPYLTFSSGALQFNWDINQRTQLQEGRGWEPMFHLGFGWNLRDWFAPELNIRFTTDKNRGRREYIAGANLGFVFTFLAKPFLNFDSFRILPFIKPGFVFQALSLPGDVTSSDNQLTNVGLGAAIGGGIRFLYNEYLYFGVEANEDFVLHPNNFQQLSGGNTLIYSDGLKKQLEILGMVGVHF